MLFIFNTCIQHIIHQYVGLNRLATAPSNQCNPLTEKLSVDLLTCCLEQDFMNIIWRDSPSCDLCQLCLKNVHGRQPGSWSEPNAKQPFTQNCLGILDPFISHGHGSLHGSSINRSWWKLQARKLVDERNSSIDSLGVCEVSWGPELLYTVL